MKVNSLAIRDKDMESSNGRTVVSMRDSGSTVSNMAEALSSKLMVLVKLVFGKMARIFSGLMTIQAQRPRMCE